MSYHKQSISLTDREIVGAILSRDTLVTREYLYGVCYPLFKSVFDKYYTDCDNCHEFIDEIYLFVMTPQRETGICRLAGFGFRCTLTMWLKIVSENYCRQIYFRRGQNNAISLDADDRKELCDVSLSEDLNKMDNDDLNIILEAMPNERYRSLLRLRYLDELTNEETAMRLGLSMANYYNTHRRAKDQFRACLGKEGLI